MPMEICGRSGKVLIDRAAVPSKRYKCANCGKRFAKRGQATGHLSVCPARLIEVLPKETVIRTGEGNFMIVGLVSDLSGIDPIDEEKGD